MQPNLLLGLAGAGAAYWYFFMRTAQAALPPGQTVSAGGRTWILRDVAQPLDARGVPVVGASLVDVYAPAGSWGPHAELRVIRYAVVTAPGLPKILAGVGANVPIAMRDAAMAAFGVKVEGAA
jgi:hypothetical protein